MDSLTNNDLITNVATAFIPVFCYFGAVIFYSQFDESNQSMFTTKGSINANLMMLSNGILNLFLKELFIFILGEIRNEEISIFKLLLGIILIDTVEFWCHFMYHNIDFLYKFHKVHHQIGKPGPDQSFVNDTVEILITSSILLITLLLFKINYYEFIIITSLSYIATVCDHVTKKNNKNKFHYVHHCGDSKTNFQQPFFSYWDYLLNTHHPNSKFKIPFIISR